MVERSRLGGGIYVIGGSLTVTGSTIISNQVLSGAGFTLAVGGGIEVVLRATATISNSTIADNEVDAGAGTGLGDGGIAAGGGIQNIARGPGSGVGGQESGIRSQTSGVRKLLVKLLTPVP